MKLFRNYSVSGIPVTMVRKNVKTLRLRFSPDGKSLILTAPLFAGDLAIGLMLEKSQSWVEKNKCVSVRQEKQFISGDSVYLWGQEYRLEIKSGSRMKLDLAGDRAVFTVPEGTSTEQKKAYMREWYRAQLQAAVHEYLALWTQRTGLIPSSWSGKAMKTRWGTCNVRTGKIWLSIYLAQKDKKCLEYVIVHELCHLKYPNHGEQFKALLAHYIPDWQSRKKLLNRFPTDAV